LRVYNPSHTYSELEEGADCLSTTEVCIYRTARYHTTDAHNLDC